MKETGELRVLLKAHFENLKRRFFSETMQQKRSHAGRDEYFANEVSGPKGIPSEKKIDSKLKQGFLEVPLTARAPDQLDEAARAIIKAGEKEAVWLFTGEMGVGKTTLIKAICRQKGVLDEVSSPTFSIVNEYLTEAYETIYHFDFYRLEKQEEALDIGLEEYLYSGNLCMLEWPEKIEGLLPQQFLRIDLAEQADQSRLIKMTRHG